VLGYAFLTRWNGGVGSEGTNQEIGVPGVVFFWHVGIGLGAQTRMSVLLLFQERSAGLLFWSGLPSSPRPRRDEPAFCIEIYIMNRECPSKPPSIHEY
jgi:hypothetical protein